MGEFLELPDGSGAGVLSIQRPPLLRRFAALCISYLTVQHSGVGADLLNVPAVVRVIVVIGTVTIQVAVQGLTFVDAARLSTKTTHTTNAGEIESTKRK